MRDGHILEIRDVTKRFGGVTAVNRCSLVLAVGHGPPDAAAPVSEGLPAVLSRRWTRHWCTQRDRECCQPSQGPRIQ